NEKTHSSLCSQRLVALSSRCYRGIRCSSTAPHTSTAANCDDIKPDEISDYACGPSIPCQCAIVDSAHLRVVTRIANHLSLPAETTGVESFHRLRKRHVAEQNAD